MSDDLLIWAEVVPEASLPIGDGFPEDRSIVNGEVRVEFGILIEPQLLDDIVQDRLRAKGKRIYGLGYSMATKEADSEPLSPRPSVDRSIR